jgi:hypothetical protein
VDLGNLALAVKVSTHGGRLSARTAAQCLSGVVGLVAQRFGIRAMQDACAELVRYDAAWDTDLGKLPRDYTGAVGEALELVATVARGVLPLSGATALREALAYWATESDPAAWMSLAR